MASTPIYIRSLTVENIRTFGSVELNFEKKDGVLPQWTIILGDNGIGKSTLLQLIAWMKPYLPYKKSEIPKGWKATPMIDDEQNESLTQLVRKGSSNTITSEIKATYVANYNLKHKNPHHSQSECKTKMTIGLEKNELSVVEPRVIVKNKDIFFEKEIIIYAYSASRRLGKLNINDPALDDTLVSFIEERTVLYDANQILHYLDYAEARAPNEKVKDYRKFITDVKKMLIEVLPDFEEIDDIEIIPPRIERKVLQPQDILITTKHGKKIPFNSFSLGYKTVVSWTVDLAWRLLNEYPEKAEPLKEPAIVIIDEIDLHLHPKWQREIVGNLSNHFPKVQFIATAHSPLIVQSALDANYAVLQAGRDGVNIINEPEDIDGWRIDQILTSEFFGLKTARGPQYEKLIDERKRLINKSILTAKEEKELKRITSELSKVPSGETPEELEDRKVISNVVEKIKNSNIKIEI